MPGILSSYNPRTDYNEKVDARDTVSTDKEFELGGVSFFVCVTTLMGKSETYTEESPGPFRI